MRYVIKKLFKRQEDGFLASTTIHLYRKDGQTRQITGKIGSESTDGFHITELRGSDRAVAIDMEAGTTLHIEPLE